MNQLFTVFSVIPLNAISRARINLTRIERIERFDYFFAASKAKKMLYQMSQWVGNQRAQSLSTLDEHIFSILRHQFIILSNE